MAVSSRRPRLTHSIATLLTATTLVVGSCGGAPSETSPPETTAGTSVRATNPPGTPARLVRVLDGDSLEVDADGRILEVRLIGINAPEADECLGDEARESLQQLATDTDLVLVAPDDGDDDDRFGRALRFVWADGADIGVSQLARGNAVVVQSGHREEDRYLDVMNRAISESAGMWEATCGPAGPATITILPPNYDPPGRDSDNALREFVDLRNDGSGTVDLAGWTLRDESSQHRYVFGEVTLPAGQTVRIRSGCGDDRELDLAWCADDAVWSNGGDTVIVQDRHGNVVAVLVYRGDF